MSYSFLHFRLTILKITYRDYLPTYLCLKLFLRDGTLCIWEANIEPSDLSPFTHEPPRGKKKKSSDEDQSEDEVDLTSGELRNEGVEAETGSEYLTHA